MSTQTEKLKAFSAGDQLLVLLGVSHYQLGRNGRQLENKNGQPGGEAPLVSSPTQPDAAQSATDFRTAIGYFQSLRETFPQSSLLDQAIFWQAAASAELVSNQMSTESNLASEPEKTNLENPAVSLNDAAELYVKVANEFQASPLAGPAAMSAAKLFFLLEQYESAEQHLMTAAQLDPTLATEATHWRCRIRLVQKAYQQAYDLAAAVGPEQANQPYYPNLLLDAADALRGLPSRMSDAVELYIRVVDFYPQHPHAPLALYRAIDICQQTRQDLRAIDLAQRFEKEYPYDGLLSEVMAARAEAQLQVGAWKPAYQGFLDLIARFAQHPRVSYWKIRAGWASYLLKQYDDTIASMTLLLNESLAEDLKVECHFLIGASQFETGHAVQAIEALEKAIQAAPQHHNVSMARLLMARAHFSLGDSQQAYPLAKQVREQATLAHERHEAAFWLAEFAYQEQQYSDAETQYRWVIDQTSEFAFLPDCWFGLARSQFENGQQAEAALAFDHLLKQYPTHPLAAQAELGRGLASRQAGQPEQAVQDLESYLAKESVEDSFPIRYELGLAYVSLKKWPEVIRVLTPLADVTDEQYAVFQDDVEFELASAHLHSEQSEEGRERARQRLTGFVQRHADSSRVPEAHHHLGQIAFAAQNYQDAITSYQACLAGTPTAAIQEQTLHKLAWCYFHTQDFNTAHQTFEQLTQLFPQSALAADSRIRASESLFRGEEHVAAVQSYKATLKAIEGSVNVSDEDRRRAAIYGARSANFSKEFQTAIEFVEPLTNDLETSEQTADAYLELGIAYDGLEQPQRAQDAWQQSVAAAKGTLPGAHAQCLLAKRQLEMKEYENAIRQFRLVLSGYGGKDAPEEIRPWQAYAAFEAARGHYLQIDPTTDQERRRYLLGETKRFFDYIVQNYPQDALYDRAKGQSDYLQEQIDSLP